MNERIAKVHELIKTNTDRINPNAYIKELTAISRHDHSYGPLDSDGTLTRISAVYNVIAKLNYLDHLSRAKMSVDLLNQWRSMQGHKPPGFQELMDLEGRYLFNIMIEAGFGEHQLRAAAFLIPYDLLKDYDLLDLRREDSE